MKQAGLRALAYWLNAAFTNLFLEMSVMCGLRVSRLSRQCSETGSNARQRAAFTALINCRRRLDIRVEDLR